MIKLNKVPLEVTEQVSKALALLCAQLPGNIKAIYLYGSSIDGGLRPRSDITLTIARIWYSALTGDIATKDFATEWLRSKVPSRYQDLLVNAQEGYLEFNKDVFDVKADRVMDFVSYAKIEIKSILEGRSK